MERGPIQAVLIEMIDTDAELDLVLNGGHERIELRQVLKVDPLHSANGLRVQTKANTIWIDASHVSAMWQARVDLN